MLEFNCMPDHFYRLNRIVFTFIILTVILISTSDLSCSAKEYPGPPEAITVGATPLELNLLLYVAEERGFFTNNGIQVVFKDYDTGAAATEGLLRDEVDIGLAFESVIVGNILRKQDVIDLATIDKAILFYIVVRNDRSINTFADLKGRKIGIPRQTIMEFFLGRTLELNRLSIQQVNMVNIAPLNSLASIASGDFDAIVTFEPHVTDIKKKLGNTVTIWPVQGNQMSYWSVIGTSKWINAHSELARRFFKSLTQAEEYFFLHDAEARVILINRLKYDESYVADVWSQNQFGLSLDKSLIIAMEDEARWMISNSLTTEKQMPNFNNYIYEDALKAVKPAAVNIR